MIIYIMDLHDIIHFYFTRFMCIEKGDYETKTVQGGLILLRFVRMDEFGGKLTRKRETILVR